MGSCSSCEAAAPAERATAKLVTPDGRLLEFIWPVKASDVLRKAPPDYFVCDADSMELEDFVSAVATEDELQPGGLYFLLPASMLRRPLRADEMAELAVKASVALGASGGRRRRSRESSTPLEFTERSSARTERRSNGGFQITEGQRRRRPNSSRRRGGGKGRWFTSNLSAIPE